jgi:hypothetical protein
LALQILPAQPSALQPVYARAGLPGCKQISRVRHVEGLIRIDVVSTLCGVPPPGAFDTDVSLGRLPQGSYRMRLFDGEVQGNPALSAEVAFTVAPPVPGDFFDEFAPTLDYSGIWWNAQRAGEAFFVQHQVPDRLLLTWNTFAANGQPEWFVMQSDTRDYASLVGNVYRATGPAGTPTLELLGRASFYSYGSDTASFVVTVGTQTTTYELTRFPL